MRFRFLEAPHEKRKRLEQWNRWFAWRPVRLVACDGNYTTATDKFAWLETVERRKVGWTHQFGYTGTQYRVSQ